MADTAVPLEIITYIFQRTPPTADCDEPLMLKITTAYNFEKSNFPTNDVPNNMCSRPDANSADPDQTAPVAAKSLQKSKC